MGFWLSALCPSVSRLPRSWPGELEGNQAGFQACLAGSENPTWFLSILQKMSYSPKYPSRDQQEMLFLSYEYFWDFQNSWYLLGKNVDNFHKLKIEGEKGGMSQYKILFQKHFLNYFFQDKIFTETNSVPLNTSILKIWHIQMNKMSCSVTIVLLVWMSACII